MIKFCFEDDKIQKVSSGVIDLCVGDLIAFSYPAGSALVVGLLIGIKPFSTGGVVLHALVRERQPSYVNKHSGEIIGIHYHEQLLKRVKRLRKFNEKLYKGAKTRLMELYLGK